MKRRYFAPLLTYPDAPGETILDNAVDLAANCNAALHASVLHISIPAIVNPWSVFMDVDAMARQAEERSRQQGKALAASLKNKCVEASIEYEISVENAVQSDATDVVVREARLFDLSLMESGLAFAGFAEAMVFESGRPVLLYPPRRCPSRFDHIAVAWDGSRAAARALAEAGFLVAKAERVSVICAPADKPHPDVSASARKLLESLIKRGVNADPVIAAGDSYIGDLLQVSALEAGADLLVMGGFGHSRLREFVLGGATADVLTKTRLPVFMSH